MSRRAFLLMVALAWGADLAYAQELPVETFFRNYQYHEVKLSPDGNYLAALAPNRKRVALVVVDLNRRTANWAYANRNLDVSRFEWANTNRLVLWFSKDGYFAGGMVAVNR